MDRFRGLPCPWPWCRIVPCLPRFPDPWISDTRLENHSRKTILQQCLQDEGSVSCLLAKCCTCQSLYDEPCFSASRVRPSNTSSEHPMGRSKDLEAQRLKTHSRHALKTESTRVVDSPPAAPYDACSPKDFDPNGTGSDSSSSLRRGERSREC